MDHLRVVIDTNVFVAALRSRRGASFRLLETIDHPRLRILISVPLCLEYEEVFLRQIGHGAIRKGDIEAILDYLVSIAEFQKIHFLWRPFLPDAKDDMVLELAAAGGCQAIVTYNRKHFRGAERFGLAILTPLQLLRELEMLP